MSSDSRGGALLIAGIGALITATPWRQRGVASALMQRARAFSFDELGAPFCMLLCESRLISFYQRLGWQLVEGPLVFDQPAGKATWKDHAMALPGGGEAWPGGFIACAACRSERPALSLQERRLAARRARSERAPGSLP